MVLHLDLLSSSCTNLITLAKECSYFFSLMAHKTVSVIALITEIFQLGEKQIQLVL